jgi:hypothetical protein
VGSMAARTPRIAPKPSTMRSVAWSTQNRTCGFWQRR